MSGRRWFCTARGFELIPTQANTSGSASGPWCVEVESLAAEPNAPFVTLARASRADVWHARLYDGDRFILRIRCRETGTLIRVVMVRAIAMRLAATILGDLEETDELRRAA